jgi:hypothetical protein
MTDQPRRRRVSLSEVARRYNELVNRAIKLNYVVRDRQLQNEMVAELGDFRTELASIKEAARAGGQCELANLLFVFQCVINSLSRSLRIWGAIHDGAAADAWGALVDAQEYVAIAQRVSVEGTYGLENYAQRLADIERVVFPGWPMFVSPGLIEEGSGTCSICSKPYDDCADHVEGIVYCGRLCQRVNRTIISADHTAFVDLPHDKRCIIRYIATEDGRKRDYITWRITDDRFESAGETKDGLIIDVIVLNTQRLDVD